MIAASVACFFILEYKISTVCALQPSIAACVESVKIYQLQLYEVLIEVGSAIGSYSVRLGSFE